VSPFLQGARGAYEMILMAFEKGELDRIRPFLSDDVEASFAEAIAAREREGLTIEASFVGIKELALHDATFDRDTRFGRDLGAFRGRTDLCRAQQGRRDRRRQPARDQEARDIWTFARQMGSTIRTGSLSPPATDASWDGQAPSHPGSGGGDDGRRPARAEVLDFEALDGWREDDHAAALVRFLRTCDLIDQPDWAPICAIAADVPKTTLGPQLLRTVLQARRGRRAARPFHRLFRART
jgi:hypothetical protein